MAPPKFPIPERGLKVAVGTTATAGLLHLIYPYWRRDITAIRKGIHFKKVTDAYLSSKRFMVDVFIEKAAMYPYKPFVIYNNTIYTYRDVDIMSNKFANFARQQGLKLGDTAAMLMYNEPAYLWIYLGFAKLGISVAFLNYNLRGESITHCLDVCKVKVLVVGNDHDLIMAAKDVHEYLRQSNVDIWAQGSQEIFRDISSDVVQAPEHPIPRETRDVLTENDCAVYIFTSGTTGHPKASKITHYRHVLGSFILTMLDITPEDRIYISLPLYHSSGFSLGFGVTVAAGMTMILAKKFSVHHYWDDCLRHNATIMLYIGEVCRYLLTLPKSPEDKKNSIRIAIGNGLRPDIWKTFKERFNIPVIGEFYGATEGPMMTINSDNKTGAVGNLSPLTKFLFGVELIQYDYETAEPKRDKNGRCIPVKRGEAGLLIIPIADRTRFDGYVGQKSLTEKKIIRNAFKDDDAYFNSGDLLLLDKQYYLYFVDRIGDTFRWKGENVATTEVSEIITQHPRIAEANVYGVKVQGQDGRAGMAALILKGDDDLDMKDFYQYVISSLPLYACPRFLRVMETLDTTGTYKYKKGDLVQDGFDPSVIKQALYYMDLNDHTYKPIDNLAYRYLTTGKARL
ncbi:long-chain fatty acid transport protein 2-like [Glandiceps talaboti]